MPNMFFVCLFVFVFVFCFLINICYERTTEHKKKQTMDKDTETESAFCVPHSENTKTSLH